MIRTLRLKFICANMAIVLVMLCIILTAVLVFTHVNLENNAALFLEEIAADPLRRIRPGDTIPGGQFPFFFVDMASTGEISLASGGYYNLEDLEALEKITAQSLSTGKTSGLLKEYNLRYYRVLTPASQRIIFADASNEISTMNTMVRYCVLIFLASMVVFFFISLGLSYWAIQPVDRAWQQQKQFVSDASHELKTPLTVISLNAELLEHQLKTNATQENLRNILQGTERMRALVESLLDLARADKGLPRRQMERLDLSKTISMSVLSAEALFLETGQRLSTQIEPGLFLEGSRQHLDQLLTIFLDNARKYGDPGGAVTVSLKKISRRHCLLSVSNTGPAIPKEKLRRIFDRFYRLDPARSPDGSYGLGLSIAQAIVREHRGKVWAASGDGENCFCVRLPLRPRRRL